jgi:hypothetical protein
MEEATQSQQRLELVVGGWGLDTKIGIASVHSKTFAHWFSDSRMRCSDDRNFWARDERMLIQLNLLQLWEALSNGGGGGESVKHAVARELFQYD